MEKLINSNYHKVLDTKRYKNSTIFEVLDKYRKVYCIKVLNYVRIKEIEILKKDLPSSCIKLIKDLKLGGEYALVFPYYPNSLNYTLFDINGLIPLQVFKKWCKQIASTVMQLHKIGIIHADLKPDNILLTERIENIEQANCLICDFGISAIIGLEYSQIGAGTSYFKAKEVIDKNSPTEESDVYSIGILMLAMILNEMFYEYMKNPKFNDLQVITDKIDELNFCPNESKVLARLIVNCIKYLPSERIKLDAYLNDPFFRDCQYDISEQVSNKDPQDELIEKFDEIRNKYTKFFSCLMSYKSKNMGNTLKDGFMISLIIKNLAKQSAIHELQELKVICVNRLHKNHPLIENIDLKIGQYTSNNNLEDLISFNDVKASLEILDYFLDDFRSRSDRIDDSFIEMLDHISERMSLRIS